MLIEKLTSNKNLQAGILLGPTILKHGGAIQSALFPLKQSSFLITMSKIATIYYVFIISIKMDVMSTLKVAKRCWRFGVFPFLCSFFVTLALFHLYKPDKTNHDKLSLYTFPNIFTLSSFTVVVETLTELNLVATELGQIALSSAMISEMLQWIIVEIQFDSTEIMNFSFLLTVLLSAIVVGIILLLIVRPLVNIIVQRTPPGKPMKEEYVIMALLGPLIMAVISDFLGLYFIMGPLFYGLVLPNGPPLATTIIEKSEFLTYELFMPFFFLYIGTRTNLSGIHNHLNVVITVHAILFVGFSVKVLVCMLIFPTYKINPKHGMVIGLILNVKGIVELMFYDRMLKLKVIYIILFLSIF